MSAYICDKKHIAYLVIAALSVRLRMANHNSDFSYYHNGQRHTLPAGDYDRACEVANMLWLENIKSVSHRYPGDKTSANLPGPVNESFTVQPHDIRFVRPEIDPAQVFKAIDCYSYQSCEHDGWEASESYAFCQCLRKAACRSVIGYEQANWGGPEEKETARRMA